MKFLTAGITLICGVSAFAESALPGPSHLGLYESVFVAGYNGIGTAGGGGAFKAKVEGFATTVWCVDDQLYFAFGQSGHANVISLEDVDPDDSRVRYGSVHNGSGGLNWTNQIDLPDSAQQRYQMAAYLILQFDFLTPGDPQSGLAGTAKNNQIQNTIWSLTNNNSPSAQTPGVTTPDAGWLALAKGNYAGIDMNKWAVFSWTVVDSSGTLATGKYNRSGDSAARQTFLVQVTAPEPGSYGLFVLGLSGIYLAARRRRSKRTVP